MDLERGGRGDGEGIGEGRAEQKSSSASGGAGEIYCLTPEGDLKLNLHPGQWQAWCSEARYVVVLAGTQSGKTVFGPLWPWREIRCRGPGGLIQTE